MVGLLYATKELVFGYGQLVAAGFIKRGLAEDSTSPVETAFPALAKLALKSPVALNGGKGRGKLGWQKQAILRLVDSGRRFPAESCLVERPG